MQMEPDTKEKYSNPYSYVPLLSAQFFNYYYYFIL